jgi:hypothetical protein
MDGTWIRHPIGALFAYLALALAPVTAAHATVAGQSPQQRWPIGGPALQAARAVAVDHWGMTPCAGEVDISWGTLPADENATSTWTNQFQDYGDPKDNTVCSVTLNAGQDWDWPKLCTVFAHEFGHLAGNMHSPDPNDVMFAYYIGKPLPACAALTPVESRAPTAPRRGRPTPAKKAASRSKAYRAGTTRHPKRTGSRTRPR